MRRMDGLSAFMLDQESTGAYMHTLKIAILDASEIPDGWDFSRFRRSVAARIDLLPMLRWRFMRVPLGLHHPVWVDDPEFDLDYHVRRIACPSPGDRVALCDLISQVYAYPMDLGKGRTFVIDTYNLEDIRAVSKGLGVTINDLFVAAAAGAYRRFMAERGFDPDTGPLVTAIPVSQRPPPDEDDCIGNKSSADYLALPVHLDEPAARLQAAQHAGKIMKAHLAQAEGLDVRSILEITPPALLHLLDWFVKRSHGKFSGIWGNAALSNVPGPAQPLYLGKMRLSNWVSMGQIFHGMALNTTVWSYAGKFNLCILADRKLLPDGWELAALFRQAFADYAQLLDADADGAALTSRLRDGNL